MSADEIEPEQATPGDIGDQLMAWSHGLDEGDGGIGEMRLDGNYGYLQLHSQENAQRISELRGTIYRAFDEALDEELWLDDEAVENHFGEVTDETIFKHISQNMDKRGFAENFLAWLANEMGVEYDPWSL